jgi:hypothetical protein
MVEDRSRGDDVDEPGREGIGGLALLAMEPEREPHAVVVSWVPENYGNEDAVIPERRAPGDSEAPLFEVGLEQRLDRSLGCEAGDGLPLAFVGRVGQRVEVLLSFEPQRFCSDGGPGSLRGGPLAEAIPDDFVPEVANASDEARTLEKAAIADRNEVVTGRRRPSLRNGGRKDEDPIETCVVRGMESPPTLICAEGHRGESVTVVDEHDCLGV